MDRYIAIVDYGAGNLFSMKNALTISVREASLLRSLKHWNGARPYCCPVWARFRTQ